MAGHKGFIAPRLEAQGSPARMGPAKTTNRAHTRIARTEKTESRGQEHASESPGGKEARNNDRQKNEILEMGAVVGQ